MPSATNLTLEVRGYDNDSHLVYQQREGGITVQQNKITDLGLQTMVEVDTVAPFDTRLIELTTNGLQELPTFNLVRETIGAYPVTTSLLHQSTELNSLFKQLSCTLENANEALF